MNPATVIAKAVAVAIRMIRSARERKDKLIIGQSGAVKSVIEVLQRLGKARGAVGGAVLDVLQFAVQGLDRVNGGAIRRAAVGMITHGLPVGTKGWRHMGVYPVMVAARRHIEDVGENFLACRHSLLQQAEDRAWHVRMPQDRMRRADHLFFGQLHNVEKDPVGIGDDAFEIGLGNNDVVDRKRALHASQGDMHMQFLPKGTIDFFAGKNRLRHAADSCLNNDAAGLAFIGHRGAG